MTDTGTLKVAARGDREIVMTRAFDAPREMVFDAFTQPELLKRWFWGPDGWTLAVCEFDLKPGGAVRYVWRHQDGREMRMSGVVREVVPPERLVTTERFDDPWYPGEAVNTTIFAEEGHRTLLTQTMLCESREARDAVLKSGMEKGIVASYNRLEGVLATLQAA